ncbi:hypothetical protein AVEN_32108-1 [Araneus ventricosus]|uniref:Uncharacterized protein n=1 Tax=Araneus ventricosus TaxID=182803 RepID=A0A4Y2GEG3_ARAVE|nr:hypothetical protein AVEN_32108-1 [Araneus ventricosus]
MSGSQSGKGRSTEGSKQPVVRFRTSVNDLPKSIDLNRWEINRSLGQMEWIWLLVNVQLNVHQARIHSKSPVGSGLELVIYYNEAKTVTRPSS